MFPVLNAAIPTRGIRMMRKVHLLSVAGFILTVAASSQRGNLTRFAFTTQCRGPDALSAQLISYLQLLVTATDTGTITRRQTWGLPATSSSNVTLVTDSRTCAKAADAYSADEDTLNPVAGRQAYVIKVATVYVVWDPTVRAGEWGAYRTLDSRFNVIASIAG